MAAMMRPQGGHWVDWIKEHSIRKSSFWDVNVSYHTFGILRYILSCRDRLKDKTIIGDGSDTNVWSDIWLDQGRLLDVFGERVIYDSGLGRKMRVCSLIQDGALNLPIPTSADLMDVWTWVRDMELPPNFSTTPVVPMTSVTTLSVGDRLNGAMHNGSTRLNSFWSNRTCGQLSMGQKRRTFRDQLETRSQSVGGSEKDWGGPARPAQAMFA